MKNIVNPIIFYSFMYRTLKHEIEMIYNFISDKPLLGLITTSLVDFNA